ncbi:MAG: hypothetical protein J7K68_01950 [Candidatus Diapherotrites archaeon]|nr:hypothetical protein [Candidatus Diapherotrites archaeon]
MTYEKYLEDFRKLDWRSIRDMRKLAYKWLSEEGVSEDTAQDSDKHPVNNIIRILITCLFLKHEGLVDMYNEGSDVMVRRV